MADITISDLELAPALADDMVLAVENTTDTYAATLAMLRRLINKTFVEVENADFNALTDDGFYQCTGTPTNSPVAGAINWTLQVSEESGVVVQRAFSLDDNFANMYIRRWNGVTWTAWLDVGKGALDNKANVANTVTTDTIQTISGSKRFTKPAEGMSIEFTADTNQQTVPAEATLRQLGLYRNATYTKGDGYTSWLQAVRGSDGWTATELYARRFLESDSKEILNYIRVNVTPEGFPISYTKTPPAVSAGEEIVTAEWINNKKLMGAPNWSARISITSNYTFSAKGWLLVWQYTLRNVATYLNGIEILRTDGGHDYLGANHNNIFIPVDVGDKLTGSITGAIFIPCKGV